MGDVLSAPYDVLKPCNSTDIVALVGISDTG